MFYSFFGGVNPAPHKENTRRKPIAQLEQPPRRVYLPLTSGRDQALLPAVKPGDTVLIQGAGGGVSTAAIQLAHAAGLEVFVTSRSEDKRARVLQLGADAAFETGARLPRKVDAVIESVGAATWSHSVKSVRPGGTIAICGATTGDQPGAELTRIFFQDIRVQGNTMGSREDFARLLKFVEHADLHPVIDSAYAIDDAHLAFSKIVNGDVFGKIVLHI